jgi:superfamily II DNA/RNA helicase
MIKEKRDSLERFIREQTIGPGINGYRFVDLENEALVKSNISKLYPIEYSNEIIDIVPAAVYGTGILFPDEIVEQEGSNIENVNNEILATENEEEATDSQDSSSPDIEEPDAIQIDQMFPKLMGFTFCLDESVLKDKKLEIKLQARYYRKLKKDREGNYNKKYALLCEVEREKIEKFITQFELSDFSVITIGENSFIKLRRITSEEVTAIKIRIRALQKQIAESLFDKTVSIATIPRLTKSNSHLSNLKSTIFYELKNSVVDSTMKKFLYDITQEIELVESITDHLRNLLDASYGGYGLWKSELIERVVKIENIDFPENNRKKNYLYFRNDYTETIKILLPDRTEVSQGLKNVFKNIIDSKENDFASLSLNIQVSRDSRKEDNKIFVKVQIMNTSTPFNESKQEDNRYYSTFNELVNQKCFFGVKLSCKSNYLVPYNSFSIKTEEAFYEEDTTTGFIYEQFKDFGIGHGCSVKWDKETKTIETEYIPYCDTPDVDPIPRNKSQSSPAVLDEGEFKDIYFLSNSKAQEFKWLSPFSNATDAEIFSALNDFIDAYGKWIEIKRLDYKRGLLTDGIAKQELDKCESDFLRMQKNVRTFLSADDNNDNLKSFRLMNAAMFMQLWHSVKTKRDEVGSFIQEPTFEAFDFDFYSQKADDKLFSPFKEPASWRAFQLAFILLNLDGIFQDRNDEKWERRNEWVDLVWFPTGGGKTEAYLGLIALTIINRRILHEKKGGGTAAIMRYTLRLLTLQQYQRATLLIMALELIRRWGGTHNLGDEPINIGLWVGKNSIPNTNEDLIKEYVKLNDNLENKIPFTDCPWCKSKIVGETAEDLKTPDIFLKNRVHLKCVNKKCSFSFGTGRISHKRPDQGPIPVNLSDETIYLHPPTLLFGTVDKFAQLAHKVNGTEQGRNSDSRRIFGRGNWETGKSLCGYLPPDLIIQDELHLLLGPLGSAVALFESAVNQLCTREDGTRPKIISSTATTRNTGLQIAALFDRKVDLFPKPGVECDDSFFAFYKRKYRDASKNSFEYLSKRRYIGIIPTGRTQIWMQMRLAAIIMTHRTVFELERLGTNHPIDFDSYKGFEKAMDYYHTILSYFNSVKEVGKTQSQVQSYILKEVRRVFSRVVRPQKLMHSIYTYGPIYEAELTGRLSGEEVKNELKRVETKWNASKRLAHVIKEKDDSGNEVEKVKSGKVPPEFVVATNMISVGIDVSRFNTIIMNSMPRNTAEYIQASSRVGRDSYGIVLTVHHPFRARDVSHYEKFIEFHEKMYSYVEPISITPFTQKAIERYLGLYLATMVRHRIPRFTERNSAALISSLNKAELNQIVNDLTVYFTERKRRLGFEKDVMIRNLLKDENLIQIKQWIHAALEEWKDEANKVTAERKDFVFNNKSTKSTRQQEQLYINIDEYEGNVHSEKWQVPMSLRVIEPEAAIKINPK